MADDPGKKRTDGRLVAIVIAGSGLFWIIATWAGGYLGWSNRTRALLDMIAMAGFVFALIKLAALLRAGKNEGS